MNSSTPIALMMLLVGLLDFLTRIAISRTRERKNFKSAGIVALLMLSLLRGHRSYRKKAVAIQQFFLTTFILCFVLIANYLLLHRGLPHEVGLLSFGLLILPFLVLPFFHLLYETLGLDPCFAKTMLDKFHLRTVHALIMSANIIFVSLEPVQNVLSLIGHLTLTYLSVVGSLYFCTTLRQRPSTSDSNYRMNVDALEPALLRYLTHLLEVSYYIIVTYFVFMEGPALALFEGVNVTCILCASLILMTILTGLVVKFRFYLAAPLALDFYEERVLPLSFLCFGISTLIRLYF